MTAAFRHQFGTWTAGPQRLSPEAIESALAPLVPDGRWHNHRWTPQGFSATLLSNTVTVVIHTWPEHGLATIDVFGVGGDRVNKLTRALEDALGWTPAAVDTTTRGLAR